MIQSSTHSIEKLRHSLILESDCQKVADRFFDIANTRAFTDQCHPITESNALSAVTLWLRGIDPMSAATQRRDGQIQSDRPSIHETVPNLKIKVIKQLHNSDLCHGWGFHRKSLIIFFLFMKNNLGLVIRTGFDPVTTDFFRLTTCSN